MASVLESCECLGGQRGSEEFPGAPAQVCRDVGFGGRAGVAEEDRGSAGRVG